MKFRLCYCYVICHSVIDGIIAPVCGETTGHQWIPVARDHWSSIMFALKSFLTNSGYASELKSQDAYAMLFNPTFRMVEHQDN